MVKLNKKGFTLIELLVAISIMSLLSTIIVANYRSNEEIRKLKNQAELIVNGLEKAQNMALTGFMVENKIPLGFRFYIDSCSSDCNYQIIAFFGESLDIDDIIIDFYQFSNLKIDSELKVDFLLPKADIFIENNNEIKVENLNNSGCYKIIIDSISGRINLNKCEND